MYAERKERKLNTIHIREIVVSAIPGSSQNVCEEECMILSIEKKTNVVLVLNDRKYLFDFCKMVSTIKELKKGEKQK
ncbi:hypothetical protein A2619_04445 [candidate division WWE3 bacterium RIFOXYD1_FULL_39_9]|uniref:Uncharacterized protein n=1 Tax=candidate division WWE3 bacterium RIFOXYD1_FULL_39_9 TaxID=1802649 RepID=A0A1F4X6E4_UNCKA|nr:MAG: hypothetical protein A2619_04445 [candidate division WWE3 bacterium RIFOXYD1_FULL_39_9]